MQKQPELFQPQIKEEHTCLEYYQHLSQKSLDYFTDFGFNLVKVIERDVMTNEGPKKVPVIFIFKKDKVKDVSNA